MWILSLIPPKALGTRDPYEIDFEEFFKADSDYGIVLEVSAYHLKAGFE